jgi:hypothetical protein
MKNLNNIMYSCVSVNLRIWGGLGNGLLKQLQINQNTMVLMYLNKSASVRSTRQKGNVLHLLKIKKEIG